MMKEQQDKYSEWLKVIEQSRLMFNTKAEFYEFLNPDAKQSNGIDRAYPSQAQKRNAFRALKVEAEKMTNNVIQLEDLLEDYKKASDFYMEYFSRRQSQEVIAKQLLEIFSKFQMPKGLTLRMANIFVKIVKDRINPELLVLLLLNSLPGYNSKKGDVRDIEEKWTEVMDFLEEFVKDNGLFVSFPPLFEAKEEKNKCRLMLICHVYIITNIYSCLVDVNSRPFFSDVVKKRVVDLDLEGYWNVFDGGWSTAFWHIEKQKEGVFFATKWRKMEKGMSKENEYIMCLFEVHKGELSVVFRTLNSVKDQIKGNKLTEDSIIKYITHMSSDNSPKQLPLVISYPYGNWPKAISLTRVMDYSIISRYAEWVNKYKDENPEDEVADEGEEDTALKVRKGKFLYIEDEEKGVYYKIPIDAKYGMENLDTQYCDILRDLDGQNYLIFIDRDLFIPLEEASLSMYGIEIVMDVK